VTITKRVTRNPAKLLEMALEDLEKCEASPDYEVCMAEWCLQKEEKTCYVCLAGAVMAQRLVKDKDFLHLAPCCFNWSTRRKLEFLDSVRVCIEMGKDIVFGYHARLVPEEFWENFSAKPTTYRKDPEGFKEEIRKAIKFLRDNKITKLNIEKLPK
jgi:hypothetical protein